MQPNIILIVADDVGYGDISCYGSEALYTPIKGHRIPVIARRATSRTYPVPGKTKLRLTKK